MLSRIRLTHFKSFIDEEVRLAPFTILVGANASGKSNCLDAIRFLHGTSFEMDLAEILDGEQRNGAGKDLWPGIRGGAAEASRVGASSFSVETTWCPPWTRKFASSGAVDHKMVCRTIPSPQLIEETLRVRETGEIQADPEFRATFREALRNVHMLDFQPERMRAYGRRSHHLLGSDGANISGALVRLCEDPEEKRGLVDWLTELLAPEIEDIEFVEVKELGDVMVMFVEEGGHRISARSLSDGTLRFLGLLVALRTAGAGTTFLIEEIASGLHPARGHILIEWLTEVTRERGIQVIATTHSPAVLLALDSETLLNTVVFGRVPGQPGTLVRRLGDLPNVEEVAARKGIDQLFTTGWLEMAL